jgi:DNA-binding transcriptional LysR family regulator
MDKHVKAQPVNLHGIDLNLLVALDALLAERNVTRAGHRLSLSQPAMSAALARLRRLLDDPLLVRSGRVLQPTPFADSLADPVRDILTRVEQALAHRLRFDPACDARTFAVVASDYATVILLRPLFERLADLAPQVRVAVAPFSPEFEGELRRDEADLLVVPREVAGGKLTDFPSQTLFTDRFVCAVWRDHPAVGKDITVEQLGALPYLTYGAGSLSSFVDTQLDSLGITRQVEVTTQGFVIAPFLLRGTRFFAMVQERLGREVAEAAGIRLLEPPVDLRPITEAMFWHPRHDSDPAHLWLRGQLADVAARLEHLGCPTDSAAD